MEKEKRPKIVPMKCYLVSRKWASRIQYMKKGGGGGYSSNRRLVGQREVPSNDKKPCWGGKVW
jgi:hypothetical protein